MSSSENKHFVAPALSNSEEVSAPTLANNPLCDLSLDKFVSVRCGDYKIEGKLKGFQPSNQKLHQPCILIIENSHGTHLIRNWTCIASRKLKVVCYNFNVEAASF